MSYNNILVVMIVSCSKELEEKQIEEERAAKAKYWKLPVCDDDDDDEERSDSLNDNIISRLPPFSAITPDEPVLSIEEPDNSLSMGDEHLDTILATESDEFIKYGVETLIPIPSESEGIPEHMCDVPSHDNSPPLDVSNNQIDDFFESNEEFSSIDDDSFSLDDIDYVEASLPDYELVSSEVMEIVIPKVGGIDDDILLTIKNDILREKLLNVNLLISKIEALNANPTLSSDCKTKSSSTSLNSLLEETNTFDNSVPEFKTFCFDLEEISSGSPTTHSDSSLYASFIFDLSINSLLVNIFSLMLSGSSFLFLMYSVAPHYLLSLQNEDAIFNPGICNILFSRPDISHRCGTVKIFNTHRSHLNKCPMLIHGQNNLPLDVLLFHFYPP
nr:hypothetical protein [Tanacetum cinerariifolium]